MTKILRLAAQDDKRERYACRLVLGPGRPWRGVGELGPHVEIRLDGPRDEAFDENAPIPVSDSGKGSLVESIAQIRDERFGSNARLARRYGAGVDLLFDGRIGVILGGDDRLEECQEWGEMLGRIVLVHEGIVGRVCNRRGKRIASNRYELSK